MIADRAARGAGHALSLRGGRAARARRGRERSGALREAFAVKAGDPVVAEQVIAAGVALQVALGERGFATAKVGEQDIVVDP